MARRLPDNFDSTSGVFIGDPAEVIVQLQPWYAASVDHLVFELPDTHDSGTLALATSALEAVARVGASA